MMDAQKYFIIINITIKNNYFRHAAPIYCNIYEKSNSSGIEHCEY